MENLDLKNIKGKRFHFIGIGGISMSALSFMLKKEGAIISGSDLQENQEIKKLKRAGVAIYPFHSAKNVRGADAVVYSSAIHDDNEELIFAKKIIYR